MVDRSPLTFKLNLYAKYTPSSHCFIDLFIYLSNLSRIKNQIMETLAKLQSLIKAPKGQFNSFGKYKYRSCEDIVEAVKPIINKAGYHLTLSDEVVEAGGRVYIKATATLSDGTNTYQSTSFAREEETKKGMDAAQITGSASSYARKYALNGLFAIDDTKDSDATNKHEIEEVPTESEKLILFTMLRHSDLTMEERQKASKAIEDCKDYMTYQAIGNRLESRKVPIDQIPNPTQKDISNHLKKLK